MAAQPASRDQSQATWPAQTATPGYDNHKLSIAPERAVYYLVGDQAAVGEVAFTFGGQPGGIWPRRYLVDVDQAIAVAQDFLATGTVEQSTGPWDRTSW
jgi:hypothetical protein